MDQRGRAPQVKVQNYFSEEKPKKSRSSRCWLVCRANCEFVALLFICIIVWGVCLGLYVRCQVEKQDYSHLNTTQSMDNSTEWGTRDRKDLSWNNTRNTAVTIQEENNSSTRKPYFPLKLRTSADPSSVMMLTNSVADCKLFLIWLSIFSGGLGLFGLVGAFCCCSQI